MSDLQLVTMKPAEFAALLGKRVALRGRLFFAETGHHHKEVLMEIEDRQ